MRGELHACRPETARHSGINVRAADISRIELVDDLGHLFKPGIGREGDFVVVDIWQQITHNLVFGLQPGWIPLKCSALNVGIEIPWAK
jgi:hypothetical protein